MKVLLISPSVPVPSKADSNAIAVMQARLALHQGAAQAIKKDLAAGKITKGIIAETRKMTSHIRQAREIQAAFKKLKETGNK